MSQLVIVESPSKAKTIQKYLGKGFDVIASKGHIVDLPKSDIGIDVEKDFEPKYVVTKQAPLKDIKKKFHNKTHLILAVDPDREGEAIGWHIARQLKVIDSKGRTKKGMKLERIVFTEITKDAIQRAIKSPRAIDMNLVNSQQARRVLDRLVGYKLSPLLWKKIRFGLSAGRVQSVAVKLIVDREDERNKFKADEYWKIEALTTKLKGKKSVTKVNILKNTDETDSPKEEQAKDIIKFELAKIKNKKAEIQTEKQALKISEDVKLAEWKVSDIEERSTRRFPKAPFTTSTLQQTASNTLGFSAKRTMTIAQKLYERGIITYMRTDSTNLSADALSAIRKYISKSFGEKYLNSNVVNYKTKDKVAQEAHEAIRPSKIDADPSSLNLDIDEAKLYKLIWSRTIACQMSPAEILSQKAVVRIKEYEFAANFSKVIFQGYLKVMQEKIPDKVDLTIKKDDLLDLEVLNNYQLFTQPPPRYSEASLIKTLEEYGIGRPSTYVPIINTIQVRGYVTKEGKYFIPTDTGIIVTRLLSDHFKNIVDFKFTANMEDDLDEVANGNLEWVKMMSEFYFPFEKQILQNEKNIDREMYNVVGEAPKNIKCPKCGSSMKIKIGRYGRFYSCSKWPDCDGLLNSEGMTEEQTAAVAKTKDFLEKYKPAPKTEDGRDFLYKTGKYGKFWAHPDYPKVKDARPLEYTDSIFQQLYGNPPKTKDKKTMILRRGKFGEFWAHPKYPDVKEVVRINNKELKIKKEELGL